MIFKPLKQNQVKIVKLFIANQ